MPKNPSSTNSTVLNSRAWGNCVDSDILRREETATSDPVWRNHAHTIRRLFEDLSVDLILCVEGRPTLCVKNGQDLDNEAIVELRSNLWNLGATTLLVVERKTEIQVFSTFATPEENQPLGAVQLSSETIRNLNSSALALSLTQLIRRTETGAIYRDHRALFRSESAVDQLLLSNLRELRNSISPGAGTKALERAHALIGKFLFCCYLIDRGIVGIGYLSKKGLLATDDMHQLIGTSDKQAAESLNSLFASLQVDFNGSIFGDQEQKIKPTEIKYFRRLIAGDDLRTGQLSLFKLYNFSFIPVELISSIYQEFLSAEEEAKDSSRSDNGQRTAGAYYTPPRLAELTVDIATEGWGTLLDKRCLDGACGSGIFLVILFIRMAEEWRNRNPNAPTRKRYEFLRIVLEENLVGSDINRTACLVTCFSLYLAFLDQMDPKEINQLREALEKHGNSKILPRIFWVRAEDRPRAPRLCTVREIDFFDFDQKEKFDLVIGNPPWVSRKPAPAVKDWIFSAERNPAAIGISKLKRHSVLFPAGEQACGFMWKSSLHLTENGRVCQILPSRVFLSNNTDKFQAHWLSKHRVESVWLLADYRFILFPGADCPSIITRYRSRGNSEPYGEFEYVTPKVVVSDPREATIPVSLEDQKTISELEVIAASNKGEAAVVWKKSYWGTDRDTRLIDRLMKFGRLERLTFQPGKGQKPNGIRQWARGQGFQPATASTETPEPVFWNKHDRFLHAVESSPQLILTEDQTTAIGTRFEAAGLHRSRHPSIYCQPLLLANKACTKFLFSDFDVLFQDDFQAITTPDNDRAILGFLVAVLSSPMTQYLLFHTTANIGIERDIARFSEILDLPFPLPHEMPEPEAAKKIALECYDILSGLRIALESTILLDDRSTLVKLAQVKINRRVFKYFDISPWEESLIEDTVSIFRPSSTPASLASPKLFTAGRSSSKEREAYSEEFRDTFRSWSNSSTPISTSVFVSTETEMAVFSFEVGGQEDGHLDERANQPVEEVISHLRKATENDLKGTVFQKMRGFMYFEGRKVHILKPLALRNWTKTAALNDADAIIRFMMEEDGWGA